MGTTKKAAHQVKPADTTEIAGIEIEVDPGTVEPVEAVEPRQYRNVLLHRFTAEDLKDGNPAIYERLYKTLEPMGIAGDRTELLALVDRYVAWFDTKQEEFKAAKEQKQAEAMEKIRKIAEEAGLDLPSAS